MMGRYPLSKTDQGKQIKDLNDNEKEDKKYQDVYRPPGIVKIKPHRFSDAKDKNDTKPACPNFLEGAMSVNLGNAFIEEQKENHRKKVEKSIWLAMPTK